VKSGKPGSQVDLELTIDAPFMDLPESRASRTVPVEDGSISHKTKLRATRPGRYDLRVALFSAGRLVQALPIEVHAINEDAVDTGEAQAPDASDQT
jgi:hypothetical protein